eukprot:3931178-Rhodomonas_salina.1
MGCRPLKSVCVCACVVGCGLSWMRSAQIADEEARKKCTRGADIQVSLSPVSYTHLRAHETEADL